MKRMDKPSGEAQSPPQQTIVGQTVHTYQVSPWNFRKMKKFDETPEMTPEQNEAYHYARVKIMAKTFGWRPYMLEYGVPDPTGLYKEPKPTMRRRK